MRNRPLNATAASLLGFLHYGPLSGWDLLVIARTVIGQFWSITQSQVYRELTAMAEAGLVEAGDRGSRDRRPYAITDAGRAAFAEWISRRPGPETIRFPLLLTVAFGRHLAPERLAEFLAEHRMVHARRLAEYEAGYAAAEAAGDAADQFAMATLNFGLSYERAVLNWFDQLPEILGPSATGSAHRETERPGGEAEHRTNAERS